MYGELTTNDDAPGGTRARPKPMRQQHRPKLSYIKHPFFPAHVTQSLGRNDPRRRSPEARAAVEEEVAALQAEKAWLENEVC